MADEVFQRRIGIRLDDDIKRDAGLDRAAFDDCSEAVAEARQQEALAVELLESDRPDRREMGVRWTDQEQVFQQQWARAKRSRRARVVEDSKVDLAAMQPIEQVARVGAD